MTQTVQKTFNTKRRISANSSPIIDSTAVGTKEFMNKNPLKQAQPQVLGNTVQPSAPSTYI